MLPFIPDSAPFSPEQRAWLNGFFAGLFSRGPVHTGAASEVAAPKPLVPVTLLFGSQTGGAEALAKRAAKEAGKRGFAPTILDMAQTDLARLATERNVLVITSTYGEGEPPDNAKALHAALCAQADLTTAAAPLAQVRYTVCALGDSNYVQFCQCGKDFDAFLEKRGATRVLPRVDCDVDYEEKFAEWLTAALTALSDVGGAYSQPSIPPKGGTTYSEPGHVVPPSGGMSSPEVAPAYSRARPYPATLLASRNLSGAGSAKQVNHVEFALADSGLVYQAGDALGVVPHNCPDLVTELLKALECDGEEAVPAPDGRTVSLRHALTEWYDLGKPTPELTTLFHPGGGGGTTVALQHVIDVVLSRTDRKVAPADFVRSLKRLQPRLYSISSSPRAHAGQVHLTVGAVRYEFAARVRKGVCSTFLSERAVPGEAKVGIFVHSNPAFRPPASGDTPMIMVGPGTGIAPFRGFLHERKATGAKGGNWLFFGDQRSATDFIYRDELAALQTEGVLTKLDLAWSRDQDAKIYVQTRMIEQASELFRWLEAGAHFYVCGDATRMAKDVDAALHTVIERAGGKSASQAAEYVQALRAAKRYCRDVY